jgi:hypothetical protein
MRYHPVNSNFYFFSQDTKVGSKLADNILFIYVYIKHIKNVGIFTMQNEALKFTLLDGSRASTSLESTVSISYKFR